MGGDFMRQSRTYEEQSKTAFYRPAQAGTAQLQHASAIHGADPILRNRCVGRRKNLLMINKNGFVKVFLRSYWFLASILAGGIALLLVLSITYQILVIFFSFFTLIVVLLYLIVRLGNAVRNRDLSNGVYTSLVLLFCLSLPYLAFIGFTTFKVLIYNDSDSDLHSVRFVGASNVVVGTMKSREWRVVVEPFHDDNALDLVYEKNQQEKVAPVFEFISGGGQNKLVTIE